MKKVTLHKTKDDSDKGFSYIVKINTNGVMEKHRFTSKEEALLFIRRLQDETRMEQMASNVKKR